MKHDLHDLLTEAAVEASADAPRLVHTVDDIVSEGRRLRRRRRAGWAAGGAAAAVLAVAGAAAVPQLVAGGPEGAPAPSLAPAAPRPAAGPVVFPADPTAYAFRGYTVGRFEVGDPSLLTPWFQQAPVRVDGEMETVVDDRGDISAPGSSLLLTVYRPGVFDPKRYTGAERLRVQGRPAFFSPNLPIDEEPVDGGMRWPALAWQYADDAWAVLDNVTPEEHGRADLVAVANGLRGTRPVPATVALSVGWLPDGYRFSSGGRGADWPHGGGGFQATGLRFVRGDDRVPARLTMPVLDPEDSTVQDLRISLYRRDWAGNSKPPADLPEGGTWCNAGNDRLCYRLDPSGGWKAEVYGSGRESTAELRRVLERITFATVADPGTWPELAAAVPAPAR